MDEINEIEKIKRLALETRIDYEKFKAINTLAAYGESAIMRLLKLETVQIVVT